MKCKCGKECKHEHQTAVHPVYGEADFETDYCSDCKKFYYTPIEFDIQPISCEDKIYFKGYKREEK